MISSNFVLWENDEFIIKTPFNPHTSYEEGLHIIVTTQNEYKTAWDDPTISGRTFELATKASKIIVEKGLAPWVNLQANGNWGLLPNAGTFFHIHVYGRNKTDAWGKPITLPELPGTYEHEPMPESDRSILIEAFKQLN